MTLKELLLSLKRWQKRSQLRWVIKSLSMLVWFGAALLIFNITPTLATVYSVVHQNLYRPIAMTLPNSIFQRWTHAREEDQEDILVYRPYNYPLPPARGREGLEFCQNGEFILYQIAPADGNSAVVGRWNLLVNNAVDIEFANQGASYRMIILESSADILKFRQEAIH